MGAVGALEWACALCGRHIQNERVQQRICISFCVKLQHSSVETIRMIQKATAVGNWWLAASAWQRACSYIMSPAECFGETSNHPGDSAPLQPRLGTLQLLDFPKTKITFEREEISMRFGKIWWGSWWGLGELCEGPRCLLWKGLRCHCPMYSVSCIFNKCLYFPYYMAGHLLDLIYPEVKLLYHMVVLFLIFQGTTILFSNAWKL